MRNAGGARSEGGNATIKHKFSEKKSQSDMTNLEIDFLFD